MKTLTAKKRLKIYKKCLKHLRQKGSFCVCIYLENEGDAELNENTYVKEHFPEFYKQRPVNIKEYGTWWDVHDVKPRITAIEKAITLTKRKIASKNKKKLAK
jgi:hypothetical protein